MRSYTASANASKNCRRRRRLPVLRTAGQQAVASRAHTAYSAAAPNTELQWYIRVRFADNYAYIRGNHMRIARSALSAEYAR